MWALIDEGLCSSPRDYDTWSWDEIMDGLIWITTKRENARRYDLYLKALTPSIPRPRRR